MLTVRQEAEQDEAGHEKREDGRHAETLAAAPVGDRAEQKRPEKRGHLAGKCVETEHLGALAGRGEPGHQGAAGRLGRTDEQAQKSADDPKQGDVLDQNGGETERSEN